MDLGRVVCVYLCMHVHVSGFMPMYMYVHTA